MSTGCFLDHDFHFGHILSTDFTIRSQELKQENNV